MKAPQFRELAVKTLKFAEYNPARRTSKEGIRELVDSMSRVGLLYPILVSNDNRIIDGHRRACAARELGWDTIAAVVAQGDADEIYATVNATSRKMGGNEALSVWVKQPNAVTSLLNKRFAYMAEVLGMKRVDRIVKEGLSFKLFSRASQIARYCDIDPDDRDFACQVVDWLLKHRCAGVVVQALTSAQPPKTILRAINNDKPLVMRAVESD